MVHPQLEYPSAMKGSEISMHVTTWMDLKGMMLNEKSQSQEVIYCMISFVYLKDKIIKMENRLVFCRV